MNDVAKNIKKIRTESGMTQEDLAEKMCVTRQTISNWETGKSQPDIETLTELAEVFSVDITEMIYGRKTINTYARFQKKYIITAIISFCVIIAVIILEFTLYPRWVEEVHRMFTSSFKLALYDYTVKPVGFLALGVFILAFLSLWVDTRLEKGIRIVILIIGICLFVLSFWQAVEVFLMFKVPQFLPGFILFSPVHTSIFLRMIFLLAMPLLAGGALLLGFNRRAAKQ